MYKKSMVIASLVLNIMLLSTMPVMAQESYKRVSFACESNGHGLVVWGAGVLAGNPPYLFGEPEYHALLESSTFAIGGTAQVEDTVDFWYLFKEGTVKVAGAMRAQWTGNDEESHNLKIQFKSNEETLGIVGHLWSPPIPGVPKWGDVCILGVGIPEMALPLPEPEYMDPNSATLAFCGIYTYGDVKEKISGVAHLIIYDWTDIKIREFLLNLWIDEPGTYVTLAWMSYETISPEEWFGPGPEILLPAKVLNVNIKLI